MLLRRRPPRLAPHRAETSLARSGRRRAARRQRVRRWSAAVLAALAAFATVSALRPADTPATGLPTVVAARDLPAGAVLTEGDLLVEPRPAGQRPDTATGTTTGLPGRVLTSPISAREIVTSARLRGSGLLAGQPAGTVAMSLPVLDPGSTGVAPGSRIDLYASGTGAVVARDVTVLALRTEAGSTWTATPAASISVALDPDTASRVAVAISALQAGGIFLIAVHQL